MQRKISRNEKIVYMRNNGMSVRDTAEYFGLTRQAVNAILLREKNNESQAGLTKKQYDLIKKVIYPNIRNWLIASDKPFNTFCCEISNCNRTSSNSPARTLLHGKGSGNIDVIKKILELTGMDFETAFSIEGEGESETKQNNETEENT